MLDTQVYSNTGGQNSDSTPMLGGNDMNVFGTATQGKNVEKKTVAETFLAGHGSPFVAQVSIANAPKLYKAILDGIEYRGTAFLQCFTTCQPEHGVADDMALTQAQRVRDSRGAPEFVFNPRLGETYQEALDLKGNPSIEMDWYETKFKSTNEPYRYTVAHWCATEARFRNHLKKIKQDDAAKLIPLENMLVRITQQDVVYRRYLVPATARTCPTSASTSRFREPTATSSTGRSRGSSCCSASSAARRGGCCRARRASRTGNTRPSARSWPTSTPARSPRRSCSRAPELMKERMPSAAPHKPAEPSSRPPAPVVAAATNPAAAPTVPQGAATV